MKMERRNLVVLSCALANVRLNKFTDLVEGGTRVMDFRFDWVHAAAAPQGRHLPKRSKPRRSLGPGRLSLWTFMLRTTGH